MIDMNKPSKRYGSQHTFRLQSPMIQPYHKPMTVDQHPPLLTATNELSGKCISDSKSACFNTEIAHDL